MSSNHIVSGRELCAEGRLSFVIGLYALGPETIEA